jgi:hypothetical protein
VDDEFGVNVRVGVIVGVPVAGFMITTCVVGLGDGLGGGESVGVDDGVSVGVDVGEKVLSTVS